MPTGKNWSYFIYINLAFAIYIGATFYLNSVQQIKANWAKYRCNPLYMPLSDNIEKDFIYCIQNMQSNFMGYILQPITYITSSLSGTLSSFTNEINMARAMFNKIRTFNASIIQSVFGVFLNLVIEFQKIIIGIKDVMGKTIGIMVTLMYIVDGTVKTMNSGWNGPPGQMVRALGKCFHPDTKIKLVNGDSIAMKDVHLGDVLENGSRVETIMKIDNLREKTPLWVLKNKGVDDEDIYVTGMHLIYDENKKQFVRVENYPEALKCDADCDCDWFSCLITSDHKIKIGSKIFWDWEDHFVKLFLG
jgi:hypothetical protein